MAYPGQWHPYPPQQQYNAPVHYNQPYYSQPPPVYGHQYHQPYPQQPPVSYAPQPQPQEPPSRWPIEVLRDPNAFRRYYQDLLTRLTFNCKPLITDLTELARDGGLRMASVVVTTLEEHLRTTAPQNKLPALYVLDCICKNLGPPFLMLFSKNIERVFLTAYRDVDEEMQVKFEEVLGTWRTGGQDGGELFRALPGAIAPQKGIEEILFGRNGAGGISASARNRPGPSTSFNNGVQQLPAQASPAERSSVLHDIRRTLSLKQTQAASNPSDRKAQDQIAALQSLEKLVANNSITIEQVTQIRAQLNALAPPSVAAPASFSPPSISTPIPGVGTPLHQQTPPKPAAQDLFAKLDLSLLKNLESLASFPAALPAVQQSVVSDQESRVAQEERARDVAAQDQYIQQLRSIAGSLTNADIQRYNPEAPALLYNSLPLACQQCAARFLDCPLGHRRRGADLDRHFRNNKRALEGGSSRGISRSWFTLADDWIVPPLDKQQEKAEAEAQAAAEKATKAELTRSTVPVPSDSQKASLPCPICKDPFKSDWSEDDEDWVWSNAVEVDGTIYHALCYAETKTITSKHITSLIECTINSTAPSREGTPAHLSPAKPAIGSPQRQPSVSHSDSELYNGSFKEESDDDNEAIGLANTLLGKRKAQDNADEESDSKRPRSAEPEANEVETTV